MSLHLGLTGEYLVAADLCKQGFTAFLSASFQRYDLVVDIGGRLLRVQVKTTAGLMLDSGHRNYTYKFGLAKGKKPISASEVDIVALVAFDTGHIAYLPAHKCTGRTLKLKPAGAIAHSRSKKHYNIDQLPFSEVLKEIL